jgi:hypothetical protein
MLKYGITVTGVAIPALSHLIPLDGVGQGLKLLKTSLKPKMEKVIDYLAKATSDDDQAVAESSGQMFNNEALEGADLRQLESFIKTKDGNRVLGNMYRTVTGEGHVKWVCIDHYRENYQEKAVKAFRETLDALKGSFDENIGRVEVELISKVQAEQFYQVLEKAKSVYELKLGLLWETTQNDFKRLQATLSNTCVGVLELDLGETDGPTSDVLYRSHRFDPILGIMRHPSIQSFSISGPRNFSKRSNILSRDGDFSNLRHLGISLDELQADPPGVMRLISKAKNLSKLSTGTKTLVCGSLRLTCL